MVDVMYIESMIGRVQASGSDRPSGLQIVVKQSCKLSTHQRARPSRDHVYATRVMYHGSGGAQSLSLFRSVMSRPVTRNVTNLDTAYFVT